MHNHDNLKELNEYNTELYINDKKMKYKKYFQPEKEGIYSIILKNNINIKDCSYMFCNCDKITDIDLTKWDTKNVTNMSGMFCGCISLNSLPDISKWDTKNVTNMNDMFCWCESLNSLPDISKWDTKNVTDMSYMFSRCNSLNSLPDISKWDTKNVTNMRSMFSFVNENIVPKKFKKYV